MMDFIKKDIARSVEPVLTDLNVLRNKTILITGGTGFVGSWVARTLAWLNDEYSYGCEIILLSRNPKTLEEDPDLFNRPDISFIKADVRSIHDLPKNVNYIIHAAASPDNRVHMSDPVGTMDVIAIGTKSVLDAASRLPDIKSIVHLSSGQVYGQAPVDGGDLSEKMLGRFFTNEITSIYPEAKRYSEAVCLAYRSLHKLPITILRPFSFIGPYQKLNKPWAINSFLQEALNSQTMRILGNGKPLRSYLYASDMAVWILAALAEENVGQVYNLGASEAVSLSDLTTEINSMMLQPVGVVMQGRSTAETRFIPSVSHIKDRLNVREVFSFKDALNNTIKWNVERLGSCNGKG